MFDSWYAGLENLKLIRSFDWLWLTRLKSNRKVNPDREGLRPVSTVEIGERGRVVWLEGYGLIRVFKIVATDGDVEWWATNKVEMSDLERVRWAGYSWTIENYHRGLKQFCLIERAQVRSRRAWRNHIGCCLRAFLRFESHCYHTGISWFEAKTAITREAVRSYINPHSLIPMISDKNELLLITYHLSLITAFYILANLRRLIHPVVQNCSLHSEFSYNYSENGSEPFTRWKGLYRWTVDMRSPSEEAWWVLRAQAGDREAVDALLKAVQGPLYRYILRLADDPALAEDILQEVFLRIYRKLSWLEAPELFRHWAYRIASRETFRRLKQERRWAEQVRDETLLETIEAPQREASRVEMSELAQFISRVSPAARAVIVLHYYDEMPLAEIADVLGVALGTVKSRLAYGLESLRRALGEQKGKP